MFNFNALIASSAQEFSMEIGSNRGVIAYSNGDNYFVSEQSHFIEKNGKKFCSGMKWQCVEYARRWLMEVNGITFGDIDYAVNIPDIAEFEVVSDIRQKVEKLVYHNGIMASSLQVGDLLIYSTTYTPVTGHVAVVVGKDKEKIYVGEQNQTNAKWEGEDYARSIPFTNTGGVYHVLEPEIIGWVRFYIT